MWVVLGAKDSTEVVSTVVDSGSRGDSDAAFMAGMGMAAVRITTAPTNAIEQHSALLQWRAVAAAHIRTEPHAVVSSLQPDRTKHPPEYMKE